MTDTLASLRRKLDIAAELVVEKAHGNGIREHERGWYQDAFLEQVEKRYREEAGS